MKIITLTATAGYFVWNVISTFVKYVLNRKGAGSWLFFTDNSQNSYQSSTPSDQIFKGVLEGLIAALSVNRYTGW